MLELALHSGSQPRACRYTAFSREASVGPVPSFSKALGLKPYIELVGHLGGSGFWLTRKSSAHVRASGQKGLVTTWKAK